MSRPPSSRRRSPLNRAIRVVDRLQAEACDSADDLVRHTLVHLDAATVRIRDGERVVEQADGTRCELWKRPSGGDEMLLLHPEHQVGLGDVLELLTVWAMLVHGSAKFLNRKHLIL